MLVFKSTNTVKISIREIMTNMREEGRYTEITMKELINTNLN